jgi:hypothetical protein
MAKGLYTFLQTIQVLNLVSFSLAIGAQLLYFGMYTKQGPSTDPNEHPFSSSTYQQIFAILARLRPIA